MTNAYFISYGTRANEYHVWRYAVLKKCPNSDAVMEILMEEYKKTAELPKVIVLGLPDLEIKINKAFEEIKAAEVQMQKKE